MQCSKQFFSFFLASRQNFQKWKLCLRISLHQFFLFFRCVCGYVCVCVCVCLCVKVIVCVSVWKWLCLCECVCVHDQKCAPNLSGLLHTSSFVKQWFTTFYCPSTPKQVKETCIPPNTLWNAFYGIFPENFQ